MNSSMYGSCLVYCDFAFLLQSMDEVFNLRNACLFHAKIVDDESEC